jgi:glycine hydroxymethyltransferase
MEFAEALDKGCPLTMGGPLPHVIAAKAIAFREAGKPEFQDYARRVVENCQTMAASCMNNGLEVLTGGTDNHLFLVNVRNLGITGRQAESALLECNITLNRNSLPSDPNGPWYTSGLRIGSAAVTTLGMGKDEVTEIGNIISLVLKHTAPAPDPKDTSKKSKARYTLDAAAKAEALDRVRELLSRYPVYPELDLDRLKKAFVR